MTTVCFNDAELKALYGLPSALAQRIYMLGLRLHMDYGTGVVGVRRKVSWQSLSEALYIEPHQGIKGGSPTKKELRGALVWLQKAGLLSANLSQRNLVFECLLASRDNCARKKVGRSEGALVGTLKALSDSSNDEGLSEMDREKSNKGGRAKNAKVGIPPAFKSSSTTTPSTAAPCEGCAADESAQKAKADVAVPAAPSLERFGMRLDWQPDVQRLGLMISSLGVNPAGLTAEVLGEFRLYWAIDGQETLQTQAQWELKLARWLKRLQDKTEEKEQAAPLAQSDKSTAPSAERQRPAPVSRKASSGNVIPLRAGRGKTMETLEDTELLAAEAATPDELLAYVWSELTGLYGQHRFSSHFGKAPNRAWARALDLLSSEQIANGLRNLIASSDENPNAFPPSALEFRHLCLQVPGLPALKRAWREALHGQYSHEAVELAAKATGLHNLKNARSGLLDRYTISALKESFEIQYQVIKERLQKGEPLEGRQELSAQQRQAQQEAWHEQERLKRLIDLGEKPNASESLRREAQRAREQLREQFGLKAAQGGAVLTAVQQEQRA